MWCAYETKSELSYHIFIIYLFMYFFWFYLLLCFIIDLTKRSAFSSLQIIPQLKKIRAIMATKPLIAADRVPAELVVTAEPHEALAVC